MKTVVYAGTFDPITYGHLDIAERASHIFSNVIVAVAEDNYKEPLFTLEERCNLVRQVVNHLPNVSVEPFEGLLVDFCMEKKASVIVRGLRAVSDFEKEFQMALLNKKMQPAIETVFLMSAAEYLYISSSLIKRSAALKGCIDDMVPPVVMEALNKKFGFI